MPAALAPRLPGTPADGSRIATTSVGSKVIWVDAGDEVLVHLDSMRIRILDRVVLVSVDLETDQTGRTPLIVSFSLGGVNDSGGLVATTDDLPRGNGLLGARWAHAPKCRVTTWRVAWPFESPLAKRNNQERVKSFFKICYDAGIIPANPASQLSSIQLKADESNNVRPFEPKEYKAIPLPPWARAGCSHATKLV